MKWKKKMRVAKRTTHIWRARRKTAWISRLPAVRLRLGLRFGPGLRFIAPFATA
jgi:hypothetical protein